MSPRRCRFCAAGASTAPTGWRSVPTSTAGSWRRRSTADTPCSSTCARSSAAHSYGRPASTAAWWSAYGAGTSCATAARRWQSPPPATTPMWSISTWSSPSPSTSRHRKQRSRWSPRGVELLGPLEVGMSCLHACLLPGTVPWIGRLEEVEVLPRLVHRDPGEARVGDDGITAGTAQLGHVGAFPVDERHDALDVDQPK